jgi:hypothetical protein
MPEAARVLRPCGLLAFSMTSPIASLCWHPETGIQEPVLHRDYFGMHRLASEGAVTYQLPYGEWIGLFKRLGFVVDRLIEPRPAADATSTYWDASELDWAHRWPAESIWVARKRA